MRDPHVAALHYRLKHSANVGFNQAPPVSVSRPEFDATLENANLSISMHTHCSTVGQARELVERFLRSWQIQSGVDSGQTVIWFDFDRSEIVDRDPPAHGEPQMVVPDSASHGHRASCPTIIERRRAYPDSPNSFLASPHVVAMWDRYESYLQGKEPLLSMAYACLTLLEGTTGAKSSARKAVCKQYSIAHAVRDKLGDLVSERGGFLEARKFGRTASMTSLTDQERRWIEKAVLRLIRRKAEYDFNPQGNLPEITMNDLPPL